MKQEGRKPPIKTPPTSARDSKREIERVASLLMRCNSPFSLQLSSQLRASALIPRANNLCQRSLPSYYSAMAGASGRAFPFVLEAGKQALERRKLVKCFKVEAVAPSWRPCLVATAAPPVSYSRSSPSFTTATTKTSTRSTAAVDFCSRGHG